MRSKKINKKIKNVSKTSIVITILVFIVLFFMSTGYAVLTQKLGITGNTELNIADYRIYISDVSALSKNGYAYESSSPTHTDNELAVYSTLANANSSITYEVTIKNTGNSDAIVDFIHTSNNNNIVKYKISGIHSGEVIPRLSVKKVRIIVEASENSGSISNISSAIIVNFTFLKKSDSYSNECTLAWDGTSSSEPVNTNILGTNYYQISNANEFKWFMDQINNGNTSINGMLTNNICLNNKAFTPIGTNSPYTGILDGQNRTIDGIYVYNDRGRMDDHADFSVGFFMNNNGVIKNLNVNASYTESHMISTRTLNLYLGGVVVNNSGIIENVSFNGTINLRSSAHSNCLVRDTNANNYVGGIVANNTGIVRGSYNKAEFTINAITEYTTCNLYDKYTNIYAAGIVSDNNGYVSDSYNKGTINSNGENEGKNYSEINFYIGGIVSRNNSNVKNGYNLGAMTQNTSSSKGVYNFKLDSVAINSSAISNIFLLSGSSANDSGVTNATVVSATDLINLTVPLGNGFIKDSKNINNGYPTLFWE